jgi:hypothetical protein
LTNDYRVKDLKHECVEIIKTGLTIENVCSHYCDSIRYKLSHLKSYCFEFASNKMNQICVTKGFLEMDENSKKKF